MLLKQIFNQFPLRSLRPAFSFSDSTPLYEKLGGEKIINQTVEKMYHKIIMDQDLSAFFKGINVSRIKSQQKNFLTLTFDGPSLYKGREMKQIHNGMGIQHFHMDLMKSYLTLSMRELHIKESLIGEALKRFESFRKDIVTQKTSYSQLGGLKGIMPIVESFHKRITEEQELNFYFKNSEPQVLKDHTITIISTVLGAPLEYTPMDIRAAHGGLNIADRHFYLFKSHLSHTLREFKFEEEQIDSALMILESYRNNVLNRESLYERFGQRKIEELTEALYVKIMANKILKPFFKNSDVDEVIEHQKRFLTYLFGGPNAYEGRDLQVAHANMNIKDRDFDELKKVIGDLANELNLDENSQREIFWAIEKQRKYIVNKNSLIEKLGGEGMIRRLIERTYDKVLSDAELSQFFESINVDDLKAHQRTFFKFILGGERGYTGRDLRIAHKKINVTEKHFEIFRNYLEETLKEFNVKSEYIEEIKQVMDSKKRDVTNQ